MDVVFLWINASDPRVAVQLRRAHTTKAGAVNATGDGAQPMRYRSFGELELSIASVKRFARGVGRMFLITSGERPTFWHNDVRLIKHASFIPRNRLPTFSTHAIHAWLHRLSRRLSNPFLLMDDDILLTSRLNLRHLNTNYLAGEGQEWPLKPLANRTFLRGVQNSVLAIRQRLGAGYARQHVPSHTPQLCFFETLVGTARIFQIETLEHPYNPFRSLDESNLRVLWNAVDRKFGTCRTRPGDRVIHFLEMGVHGVPAFSRELCNVRDAPRQYVTLNDAIRDANGSLAAYTTALRPFFAWLAALYAVNGSQWAARSYGDAMICHSPPSPPPPPPPPPGLLCRWFHRGCATGGS